jgi:SAM-dependent methyltransferase
MDQDPRTFNAPLSLESARRLVELARPKAGTVAIDVGCGRGELLALWLEAGGGSGHGVDPLASEIEVARRRLAPLEARAHLHPTVYAEATLPDRVDVAFCIGATHAFGGPGEGLRETIIALQKRVKPGGCVLIGEGFWNQPPDPAYLAATGMSTSEFVFHADNHELGEELGLRTLYVTAASTSEWDAFEAGSGLTAERRLDEKPDDTELQQLVEQRRAWRRAYLRWGRETLGFGYYLFEVPR